MVVLFTHEIHASQIGGEFFNKGGVIGYQALRNYLFACETGILITRCTSETEKEQGVSYLDLKGQGISVCPIKEFNLKSIIENYRLVKTEMKNANYFLVRLPGLTGVFVGLILLLNRKRYGVELAGDLKESLLEIYKQPSLSTRLYIKIFSQLNKLIIKYACAVGYRSRALRNKYPNKKSSNEYVFSGAQIFPSDVGIAKDRAYYSTSVIKLLYLGRLSPEKGVDYLIQAARILKERGRRTHLTIIGDGISRDSLKDLVSGLGMDDDISFLGKISDRQQIYEIMDQCHIYVIPSITEGMPRSLIEAMSRGMVAIGSNTGGIPELLDKAFLFQPKNDLEIATKIEWLFDEVENLSSISNNNIVLSQDHWIENIEKVKTNFWKKIMKV